MTVKILMILAAFLLSIALHVELRRKARSIGLIDIPFGRKSHDGITPVVGGIAMFIAFALMSPLSGMPAQELGFLLTGLGLLVICGVIDDLLHLPARFKLAIQIVAASLSLFPVILATGPDTASTWTWPFVWAMAVLFAATMTNIVNMADGIDGLAGGLTVIALLWLGIAAIAIGADELLLTIMLLAAAVAGFLTFNLRHPWRRRASVFMGDAGSMMLGAGLAWCSVQLMTSSPVRMPPVIAIWVLALPLIDGISVVIHRIARGADPMRADSTHLHHRLRGAGLSVGATVAVLLLGQLVLSATGVIGWRLGLSSTALVAWLVLPVGLHTLLVTWLAQRRGRTTTAAASHVAIEGSAH